MILRVTSNSPSYFMWREINLFCSLLMAKICSVTPLKELNNSMGSLRIWCCPNLRKTQSYPQPEKQHCCASLSFIFRHGKFLAGFCLWNLPEGISPSLPSPFCTEFPSLHPVPRPPTTKCLLPLAPHLIFQRPLELFLCPMDKPRTLCVSIVASLKGRKPHPEISTFNCEPQHQNA